MGVNTPGKCNAMTEEFWLYGQCKSGKNSIKITRQGFRYPTPAFRAWRDDALEQLKKQWGNKPTITAKRIKAVVLYWPSDKRRRDAPGIQDALWHCLERAGIVADDANLRPIIYDEMPPDKEAPRVYIKLSVASQYGL